MDLSIFIKSKAKAAAKLTSDDLKILNQIKGPLSAFEMGYILGAAEHTLEIYRGILNNCTVLDKAGRPVTEIEDLENILKD